MTTSSNHQNKPNYPRDPPRSEWRQLGKATAGHLFMTTSHSVHSFKTTRTARCGRNGKGKRGKRGLKKGDQLALLNAGVQISDICVCFGRADNNKSNMNSASNKANNNYHNKNKNKQTKATVERS